MNKKRQKNEQFTADVMQSTAKGLKEIFSPFNMGFALVVFPFGSPGIGNYVSSAKRKDMIEALRETANRLEKKEDNVRYE